MPASPKQVISTDDLARLESLAEGHSTVMVLAIAQDDLSLPWSEKEVTITRDGNLLRVDAEVEFRGRTAGATWFSPRREVVSRPVLAAGHYDGQPACFLLPPPRENGLEIGDVTSHEAAAWAS